MSSRPSIPSVDYHQTHTVYGLPACPLCGWKSIVVHSYQHGDSRAYYTACENEECDGMLEGPRKDSAEEAGKAFNEAMKKFSQSFMRGDGGEY